MGESGRSGIWQAAKNHPVIAVGGGLAAFVASVVSILDSPTVSRMLPWAEESVVPDSGPDSGKPVDTGQAGSSAKPPDAPPPVVSTGGLKSVVLTSNGNSAERAIAEGISPAVRKEVAAQVPAGPVTRIEIELTTVGLAGSARSASFIYTLAGDGLDGQCKADVGFGSNPELAQRLATRIVQTARDSIEAGEVLCA